MVYGFEFSTIELCQVPSCGRNRQVFDFRPKFAQKGILGSNFIKLVTDSNSAPSTLGEEILAGRKFGGNKIWRNWREFNLADGGKHIFWRELNLADKHKIEYDKCFPLTKNDIFFC